ncbi:hypothetical protein ACDP95_00735 [Weissella confusa]
MGITLQIDDAMVASMAETIRKSIPRIARANEQMILSAPELSERLPKLSALPDDELVRGALMLDLRTDFSLPCKLIAEEHFLYDSIFIRI